MIRSTLHSGTRRPEGDPFESTKIILGSATKKESNNSSIRQPKMVASSVTKQRSLRPGPVGSNCPLPAKSIASAINFGTDSSGFSSSTTIAFVSSVIDPTNHKEGLSPLFQLLQRVLASHFADLSFRCTFVRNLLQLGVS